MASNFTILCPVCTPKLGPKVIGIKPENTEARCPTCKRKFRLITREIERTQAQRLKNGQTLYQLVTKEPYDRLRPRNIEAQPHLVFKPGQSITLVYRGNTLLGIANQSVRSWQAVVLVTKASSSLLPLLLGTVVLLCMLQAFRFAGEIATLFEEHAGRALIGILVVTAIALLPIGYWILEAQGSPRVKKYLPGVESDIYDLDDQ